MVFDEFHFEFGGFNSREVNAVFGYFNTDEFVDMYGEIDSEHVYHHGTKMISYIGDNYEDSMLEIPVEIFQECGDPWTQQERRRLEKALFTSERFQRLYFDMADDEFGDLYEYVKGELKRCYFECRLINPKKIYNAANLVIGYECTIQCNSHMFWQDEIVEVIDDSAQVDQGNKLWEFELDTHLMGYTYPDIDIKGAKGEIVIINETDNPERKTVINYSGDYQIKSTINFVTSEVYEHFTTKYFPRMVDGKNLFKIRGDFESMTFTFQNRRFV